MEATSITNNIKNFLENTVPVALNTSSERYKHFIIGNEAADADSIVSALCWAFIAHKQHDIKTGDDSKLFIPVIGIQSSQLRLRRDVEILLNKVDIKIDSLPCLDDIAKSKLIASDTKQGKGKTFVSLVDHNLFNEPSRCFLTQSNDRNIIIKEILDHHEDMVKYFLYFHVIYYKPLYSFDMTFYNYK